MDRQAILGNYTASMICSQNRHNLPEPAVMADTFTKSERSRIMAAVRSKDTKPEMAVRRLVHALGYRYRLHVRSLPGSPDLVFPAQKGHPRSWVFLASAPLPRGPLHARKQKILLEGEIRAKSAKRRQKSPAFAKTRMDCACGVGMRGDSATCHGSNKVRQFLG